ncbi:hypothetical protein FKM82_023717 [Ascaphus truei]
MTGRQGGVQGGFAYLVQVGDRVVMNEEDVLLREGLFADHTLVRPRRVHELVQGKVGGLPVGGWLWGSRRGLLAPSPVLLIRTLGVPGLARLLDLRRAQFRVMFLQVRPQVVGTLGGLAAEGAWSILGGLCGVTRRLCCPH